jgi:hypothetical protein
MLSYYVKLGPYLKFVPNSLKRLKSVVHNLGPRLSKFSWWIVGVVVGAIITHQVDEFLNQAKDDTEMARYYVASMPTHCKPSNSLELDNRIKRFVEATRRARASGEGIPVWREDCSIGAHFSRSFKETLGVSE